jgi:hypothetical protein
MSQYPDSWRAEWLRLKNLPQWAEYYQSLDERVTENRADMEEFVCAK